MSLPNLSNCPRCGGLFIQGKDDVCQKCVQEVEEEYQKCVEYLRENKGANLYQVSEDTGVSVKQITRFIREGRLSVTDNPNIGIPCESCGTPIKSGRFCKDCTDRLKREVGGILGENDAHHTSKHDPNHIYHVKDLYKKED
ncbi:MAG: flagellar protein [Bacillaceae bacterium]|nr:flagellar protein [Bacillaceae bacterium]